MMCSSFVLLQWKGVTLFSDLSDV